MSEQRLSKKRVIIPILVIIILLVGAVGVYYWYQQSKPVVTATPSVGARAAAKKMNLAGDQTLTAQYIDQINAKNAAAAQKLFDAAVAQAPDKATKQTLLSQNITVALSYGQLDDAERVALAAIAANPSYATYNDAYRVYVVKRDFPKQQEMLEKAIAAAKSEDSVDKDQLVAALESQLQAVQQIIAEDAK